MSICGTTLIGNLIKDLERKESGTWMSCIAVNYFNKKEKKTLFVNVIFSNEISTNFMNYLKKGSRVVLIGHIIEISTYESQNGSKPSILFKATNASFLPTNKVNTESSEDTQSNVDESVLDAAYNM